MKRWTVWAAAGAAVILLIYWKRREVADAAAVLIYTIVFSVLLSPACAAMERSGLGRNRAAGCAVVALALLVMVMVAAFIPYLLSQSISLFKRIAPMASQLMQRFLYSAESAVFTTALLSQAGNTAAAVLRRLTESLVRAGITTATQIGKIAFALVLTYYVLCDRRRIGCHLLLFIPTRWRSLFLSTVCACKNALLSYFSGLMKTSMFIACATCAGLAVLGVEDALLLGVLMGVLEILPYLGPILASIPILLSGLLDGGRTALLTLALLVVVQQIEGNFVSPYFTASSTSVHPLAAILAVFISGSLFGIWGILAAVPMLVLMQSIYWSLKQGACNVR